MLLRLETLDEEASLMGGADGLVGWVRGQHRNFSRPSLLRLLGKVLGKRSSRYLVEAPNFWHKQFPLVWVILAS